MPKNKVSEWSSTAANNTDIGSIDIAEGCAPSGINNALREIMAQVKDMQAGTDADNFTVGGNLSVTGTTTATGAITANGGVTGNLTGNVTGNVTGATTGAHNGTVGATTPATGAFTTVSASGGFTGNITGNVTGNVTGSSGSCTGNAATATSAANAIGVGQTWQDLSASRAEDVTYTNLTSRPIFISVRFDRDDGELQLTVDGLMIGRTGSTEGAIYYTLTAIIPINSTYSVDAIGAGTLRWYELR